MDMASLLTYGMTMAAPAPHSMHRLPRHEGRCYNRAHPRCP